MTQDNPGIKLGITTPAGVACFSRGFYQVDEEVLSVPVYPGGRFFSYLDSEQITFDIGDNGRLLSIQIHVPRRNWVNRGDLVFPEVLTAADIRFVDFRNRLPNAIIESSRDGRLVLVTFSRGEAKTAYQLADNIILEVTAENRLAGVWINGIEDDRAAQGQSAWLKQMKENGR